MAAPCSSIAAATLTEMVRSSAIVRPAELLRDEVAQTVQHGVYQGAVAPVALYLVLGAVVLRNRKKEKEAAQGSSGTPGGAK